MEGPLLGVPISGVCYILVYVVLKNDEDVIFPDDRHILFCRWMFLTIIVNKGITLICVQRKQINSKIYESVLRIQIPDITKTVHLFIYDSVLVISKQPWWDSCALTREMLKTR